VGERPGALLLPSLLGGAALVLAADIAVRLIPLQQEMRLGVLTSLLGAPMLLRLAVAHRGRA
jgi:iron complex transport system permease protein